MADGCARDRSRSRSKAVANITASDGSSLVPIIDISALTSSDTAAKQEVAEKIGNACMGIGFFVVVNHGIPQEVVNAAWEQTSAFFDLPLEEKNLMKTQDEAKYPYGYSALGGETLSRGKLAEKNTTGEAQPPAATGSEQSQSNENTPPGDLKEMMQIGPCDEQSGMPPRQMPARPEGFTAAWEAYYEHANSLAQRLLGAFALALTLPEEFFVSKMDRHISALRANNYPDQQGMHVPAGSVRCSAHTDYGTVTVLKSGGPGLQVSKDKENPVWHDVPYVEDGFVINLGDLMRRWTNDKWSSTLHRVVNPPAGKEAVWGRRMALAFFHNLNKDAIVETIPSCISKETPALYDPIIAGEFLMLKHLASQGKADADAHLKKRGGA